MAHRQSAGFIVMLFQSAVDVQTRLFAAGKNDGDVHFLSLPDYREVDSGARFFGFNDAEKVVGARHLLPVQSDDQVGAGAVKRFEFNESATVCQILRTLEAGTLCGASRN